MPTISSTLSVACAVKKVVAPFRPFGKLRTTPRIREATFLIRGKDPRTRGDIRDYGYAHEIGGVGDGFVGYCNYCLCALARFDIGEWFVVSLSWLVLEWYITPIIIRLLLQYSNLAVPSLG